MRGLALSLLAAALLHETAAKLTVVHQATSDDRRPRLKSAKGAFAQEVEAFGQKAQLLFRYDARAEGERGEALLSGDVPNVPWLDLKYLVLHRLSAKQTAYKLTASKAGVTATVATPFLENGPPMLCGGLPELMVPGADQRRL